MGTFADCIIAGEYNTHSFPDFGIYSTQFHFSRLSKRAFCAPVTSLIPNCTLPNSCIPVAYTRGDEEADIEFYIHLSRVWESFLDRTQDKSQSFHNAITGRREVCRSTGEINELVYGGYGVGGCETHNQVM